MAITEHRRIGFDAGGLLLFLILMLPNFIWFAFPAPHDILRAESVTDALDATASVVQIMTVISLCLVMDRNQKRSIPKPFLYGIVLSCLLYFGGWIFYYRGTVSTPVLLDLSVAPCLALLLFAAARKNKIAFACAAVFMILHVLSTLINFI